MSQVIKNIQKEFYHYKALGDRTFEQLDVDQMNWKSSSESSSIGQIVKHMNGNMLSRWTDFLRSDGEKEWRKRDDEFIDTLKTKEAILNAWESGWCCLFDALDTLEDKDLIPFKYCDEKGNINEENNPNGSLNNIAGIFNDKKNILGMMPHPERMVDQMISNDDGVNLFTSLLN